MKIYPSLMIDLPENVSVEQDQSFRLFTQQHGKLFLNCSSVSIALIVYTREVDRTKSEDEHFHVHSAKLVVS